MFDSQKYHSIIETLRQSGVTLVAVSKVQPVAAIQRLYDLGQRDFGENYVQELVAKQAELPRDIRWHFIGHLQSNKVKYIAPFIALIQGVDSLKLAKEIDRQAKKQERIIDILFQVHIAEEETKFGMNEEELDAAIREARGLEHVRIRGLMGMASFSDDEEKVGQEFRRLKQLFDRHRPDFSGDPVLSMGMSGDYSLAIREGSNMVRIGSLLFGSRRGGV